MLLKLVIILLVSFLILQIATLLFKFLPSFSSPTALLSLTPKELTIFAIEFTIAILVLTLLFFAGIEISRALIANLPISKVIRNYVRSLPKIAEYQSYFKFLFFLILVALLINAIDLIKNPLISPDPTKVAMRLLIIVGLAVIIIFVLILTNYPTYKILLGEKDTKSLIAYTFSLPSLLFAIVTTLLLIPVAIANNIYLQTLLLAIYFPLSWVVFYLAYRLEGLYCKKKEEEFRQESL